MNNNDIAPSVIPSRHESLQSTLNFDWQAKLTPITPEDFFILKGALRASSIWPFFDLALDAKRRRIVGPKGALELGECDGNFELLSKIVGSQIPGHLPEKNASGLPTAASVASQLNALLVPVSLFADHFLIPQAGYIFWNPRIRIKVLD